jgi:acetolactate synthase-1/3 small subunit
MEKKLYTLIIFSENLAGVLNQVTNVFTRRQLNIESLNASPSGVDNIHRYTITCYCDEETIVTVTRQIEKKIDVLQANYFTDDEIFIMEACLLKVNTSKMMEKPEVGQIVRKHGARIVEVNPTYSIIEKKGLTAEILSLFQKMDELGVVLQFVRSGRIAVTKSHVEQLDQYLQEREREQ